jgi:hypothetical protein
LQEIKNHAWFRDEKNNFIFDWNSLANKKVVKIFIFHNKKNYEYFILTANFLAILIFNNNNYNYYN